MTLDRRHERRYPDYFTDQAAVLRRLCAQFHDVDDSSSGVEAEIENEYLAADEREGEDL